MCLCVCNYHEVRQSFRSTCTNCTMILFVTIDVSYSAGLIPYFLFPLNLPKSSKILHTWKRHVFVYLRSEGFLFKVLIQMNVFVFSNCPCWSNSNLGQVDVYIWWSRSLHFETVGILSWRQFLHFWTILYSAYILHYAFQMYLCSFKISIEMHIQWQIASG